MDWPLHWKIWRGLATLTVYWANNQIQWVISLDTRDPPYCLWYKIHDEKSTVVLRPIPSPHSEDCYFSLCCSLGIPQFFWFFWPPLFDCLHRVILHWQFTSSVNACMQCNKCSIQSTHTEMFPKKMKKKSMIILSRHKTQRVVDFTKKTCQKQDHEIENKSIRFIT